MYVFWCRLKYFMRSILSLAVCLAVVGFICVMKVSRFSILNVERIGEICINKGESVFYLRTPSSQAVQTKYLTLRDLPFVRGESVAIEIAWAGQCDGGVENMAEISECALADALANELAGALGAKILFMEEVSGVQSYYGYAPTISDGVTLRGKKINLHIALCVLDGENGNNDENIVAERKISGVIGSPIIFGGY